ncbi:MAG: hypothetical protein NW205_01415 [Hyphomicrobiaceae bacterium]|nr:hypothetical protein [Hyphomicrobiaceae bacterium]
MAERDQVKSKKGAQRGKVGASAAVLASPARRAAKPEKAAAARRPEAKALAKAKPVSDAKAVRGAAPADAGRSAGVSPPGVIEEAIVRLEMEVRSLAAERDRLTAELMAARQQVSALEAANAAAVTRIDWVIDSLQSLLEDRD